MNASTMCCRPRPDPDLATGALPAGRWWPAPQGDVAFPNDEAFPNGEADPNGESPIILFYTYNATHLDEESAAWIADRIVGDDGVAILSPARHPRELCRWLLLREQTLYEIAVYIIG